MAGRKLRKVVASAVVAGAAMAAVSIPDASHAAESTIPSTVTVKVTSGNGKFFLTGEVKTRSPSCRQRFVDVWRKVAGPDQQIASVGTNPGNGNWSFEVPAGTYYVKITRKFVKGDGRQQFCEADRSREVKAS